MPKNNRKTTRLTTPFGRVVFAFLNRPSYKFQKDAGEFSIKLHLDDSPETREFIERLDALYDESAQLAAAEQLAEKPLSGVTAETIKRADRPYKPAEDPDTGAPVPGFVVNARLKHRALKKLPNGQYEVMYTRRPVLQDAKLNPVRQEIGGGSTARMSVEASTFFVPALGAGISLRLVGVQVTDLVAPGVGNPEFSEVDGYVESQSKASDPVETIHAPSDDSAPAAESESGTEANNGIEVW